MGDLAQGQIGPETQYVVKFEAGKLRAELKHAGAMGGAGLYAEIGVDQVIDAVKEAIPGKIDDAVLDLLKAALKAA